VEDGTLVALQLYADPMKKGPWKNGDLQIFVEIAPDRKSDTA